MVLPRLVTQLTRMRQLHQENAKEHKRLIRVLDSIQLETMKSPTKIAVEIASFEELATLASHFYERDVMVKEALDKSMHLVHALKPEQLRRLRDRCRTLRRDLTDVKDRLRKEASGMDKTMKRLALVVEEFRTRCRETYTEYLKGLDAEMRKILKPLVPSQVLAEQIKYRKISDNPSVQSSLQSTIRSELREGQDGFESSGADFDPQAESRDQLSKLNAHIELLVNTLETVAKDLISVCGDINRRYYEVVNPAELISGPPTPLAAPLPEYFSFKAADYIEDQLELMNIVDPGLISDSQRHILVQKLMKLNQQGQLSDNLLQPEKADKLRRKLEAIGKREMDIRELNLEELFKDATFIAATEREKLVYSLINSERPVNKDVTLDEIINASKESDTESVKLVEHPREHRKKSARKRVERGQREGGERTEEPEDVPPPPGDQSDISEPPLLTDISYDGHLPHDPHTDPSHYADNFYTPQADALRRPQSFFEQHRRSLPPITKLDKKGSRSTNGMKVQTAKKEPRVRSVTPVQGRKPREERKTPVKKSSRSPVPRKPKPVYQKKHSVS